MSGKSQSSLIILVMIAMLIIFIWIFSLFWNQASQARTLASEKFTKLAKYLDIIKGLSRNYLIFSSQLATKKVAQTLTTYYYNDPTPPTINEIRSTLSTEALKLLNKYVANTHFKEAVFDYKIDNFACVDFPIDQNRLNNGEYDERYYVGGYGSAAELSDGDNKVSSNNDIFETVTRDRFFLLYRKFTDWSNNLKIFFDTGDCLRESCDQYTTTNPPCDYGKKTCEDSPEFAKCLKDLLDRERDNLVKIINDPYVECKYERSCCVFQVDWWDLRPEKYSSAIPVAWNRPTKPPACIDRNGPEISDFVCSETLSFSSYQNIPIDYGKVISFQTNPYGGAQYFPVCEPKVAYKVTYSCIDKKYELSTPSTPGVVQTKTGGVTFPYTSERKLQYNVDVTVFVRRHCGPF